ncbi:MAG: metal-dependent transcriptional regulator [Clostridia bacterium]|nr:metal-dependent transcriptional regulator [Clostridia bacterium]
MHTGESAEMYLECILELKNERGEARSIDVARRTGYSKPSVSRAMGLLKKNGYIEIDGNGYIFLTSDGQKVAEKIFERHKLITEFLVRLGVSEDIAAEDACRIEHVISDESFAKIKEFANNVSKINTAKR